jgi:hypothetical protein
LGSLQLNRWRVPTCLPPAPLLTEVLEAVTASTLNSDGLPVAGLVCVETMTEFVPERRWACEPGLLGILLWYRPGLFQCYIAISGPNHQIFCGKSRLYCRPNQV